MFETRFSASDVLYSLANNESDDQESGVGINIGDVDESLTATSTAYRPISHQTKKHRFDKHQRKKLKRPASNLPETFLTPPTSKYETPDTQFKRKQSITIANRASIDAHAPILIGSDVSPSSSSPTDRPPNKNGFTPIHAPSPPQSLPPPIGGVQKNGGVHGGGGARVTPSKVLIKRVNYNYHPIIDFFVRDRAAKTAKAQENGMSHTIVS